MKEVRCMFKTTRNHGVASGWWKPCPSCQSSKCVFGLQQGNTKIIANTERLEQSVSYVHKERPMRIKETSVHTQECHFLLSSLIQGVCEDFCILIPALLGSAKSERIFFRFWFRFSLIPLCCSSRFRLCVLQLQGNKELSVYLVAFPHLQKWKVTNFILCLSQCCKKERGNWQFDSGLLPLPGWEHFYYCIYSPPSQSV